MIARFEADDGVITVDAIKQVAELAAKYRVVTSAGINNRHLPELSKLSGTHETQTHLVIAVASSYYDRANLMRWRDNGRRRANNCLYM